MIALFKRLNALFLSFVLIGVYVIGVGLARLIYMLGKSKEAKKDSYWSYTTKQRIPDDLFSAY